MAAITYTNQRVEILNYLRDNDSHPTAEEVFAAVRKKLTHISRATVYQNLKFLAAKGLIREVMVQGIARFEPLRESHHHLICMSCGAVTDVMSPELTDCSLRVAQKLKGARVTSATTTFYGQCENCTGGINHGRARKRANDNAINR